MTATVLVVVRCGFSFVLGASSDRSNGFGIAGLVFSRKNNKPKPGKH